MSLLDDKPLLHEPGITRQNPDYEPYNRIIQYKNYRFCMLQLLKSVSEFKTVIPDIEYHDQFYEHMCASFRKSHSRYSASIDALQATYPQVEVVRTSQAYQMTITVHYPLLKISFEEAVKRLVDGNDC